MMDIPRIEQLNEEMLKGVKITHFAQNSGADPVGKRNNKSLYKKGSFFLKNEQDDKVYAIFNRKVLFSKKSSFESVRLITNNNQNSLTMGSYPQENLWIIDKELALIIEKLYEQDLLEKTNKTYTTNKITMQNNKSFEMTSHQEYAFLDQKFVRCKTLEYDLFYSDRKAENYKWWYKVSPVTWIQNDDKQISEFGLIGGIPYYNDETENIYTFIKKYLEEEIMNDSNITLEKENELEKLKYIRNLLDVPYQKRIDKILKIGGLNGTKNR